MAGVSNSKSSREFRRVTLHCPPLTLHLQRSFSKLFFEVGKAGQLPMSKISSSPQFLVMNFCKSSNITLTKIKRQLYEGVIENRIPRLAYTNFCLNLKVEIDKSKKQSYSAHILRPKMSSKEHGRL